MSGKSILRSTVYGALASFAICVVACRDSVVQPTADDTKNSATTDRADAGEVSTTKPVETSVNAEREDHAAAQSDSLLTLNVSGIKSESGSLKVALFADGDGFPDHSKAASLLSCDVSGSSVSVQLDPIAAGRYAVAVYHDVDGNGQMNRALVGYPTEPYGFSNNARATLGPPDYSEAEFEARPGEQVVSIAIK